MGHPQDVTELLHHWSEGDPEALDALIPLVYEDLHRLAHYFLRRERQDHTLQPTALISEVYVRLKGKAETEWNSRKEFFAFAAGLMRTILVDHARRSRSRKRGGESVRVPLDPRLPSLLATDVDVVALDMALEQLAEVDPRQARIVELRFFIGLNVQETAEVLELSAATVKREWRTAKLWLRKRLQSF